MLNLMQKKASKVGMIAYDVYTVNFYKENTMKIVEFVKEDFVLFRLQPIGRSLACRPDGPKWLPN